MTNKQWILLGLGVVILLCSMYAAYSNDIRNVGSSPTATLMNTPLVTFKVFTVTPLLTSTNLPLSIPTATTAVTLATTRTPVVINATATPLPKVCCRVCKAGKACGDTCITKDKTCDKLPGCACNQ